MRISFTKTQNAAIVLLLVFLIVTKQSIAENGAERLYTSVKDVELSIPLKNASIEETFYEIESRTDFRFAYEKRDLDKKARINFSSEKQPLSELLTHVSKAGKLKFKQINNSINVYKFKKVSRKTSPDIEVIIADTKITGTVKDEGGEGLIGVTVRVKGTSVGTTTDVSGNFSLNVPGESATLIFSYIGYLVQEIAVDGSTGTLDIVLVEDITQLEEVIVSGLATTVKRANLANSVASISSKQLTGTITPSTFDASLYGKFKGANIVASSGAPGGGISVKLRGVTSLSGNSEPLFIIDGIYVDNSAIPAEFNIVSAANAGGSNRNQDNPSNRIADITPEDIESIEILKGASAASIYGSRSAAGVVIITTKKGQSGKTRVNFEQSIGQATILNRLGTRGWTEDIVFNQFNDPDKTANDPTNPGVIQRNNFIQARDNGQLHDYEDELFGNNGLLLNTYLSVSGGNDNTTFYSSYVHKDEEGIVENTGYVKNSYRLNINHKVNDDLDISFSSGYVKSVADRGFFNNDNSGTTMGISFIGTPSWAQLQPDANGNYPNNPFGTSNFLQTRDLMTNRESINRLIAGVRVNYRIFQNEKSQLRLIGSGGLDNYTYSTAAIFPTELQFQKDGNGTNGATIKGDTRLNNYNFQAFLVHSYFPSNNLSFTSQFGLLGLDFNRETIVTISTDIIGTQINLNQAGSSDVIEFRQPEQDKGFFIQEEVNFGDKIIATLGLRGDKSSNNGDANKMYYYPKANVAFNIHEFDFWNSGKVNQLKFRLAYGESGKFATFGSTFTGFTRTLIDGRGGSLVGLKRGNDAIGPERQSEIEIGADVGLLDNKIGIDITYYRKQVTDLLLEAEVPRSTGFETQLTNAAELENKGLEIGIRAQPISNSNFQWNTTVNYWFNKSKVTKLDVPAFNTGAFGATLGTLRIEEGESVTQLVGIDPNDTDGDGISVFGDAAPDFQLSWYNILNYKNWEFSMLWHMKQGFENVNLTVLLTDLLGTSPDYEGTNLDPEGVLNNGSYRLSQLGVSADPFIEDASYIRLREVGLYYRFKRPLNGAFEQLKVGVSGNNLINIFDYNSWDPEVSNFSSSGLSTGVEVTPFPSAKRFMFHVAFQF